MKNYFFITAAILFFICSKMSSQNNDFFTLETKLQMETETIDGKLFNFHTNSSEMRLNFSTGDFKLTADLSYCKTDDVKLDSTIKSKGPQLLEFNGKVNSNDLYLFNEHVNDEKQYYMEGNLTINNTTIPCVASFDPINFSEKADIKKTRMDFKLIVNPDKIIILGLENKINKQLIFEIIGGPLNPM